MSFKWNDLSILTKIMTCVGALIAVSSFVSYRAVDGIGRITASSAEATEYDQLVNDLLQKEIDHLKWVQSASVFVYDPQAQKLAVQADPTRCAFGEWFYGEGRRNAEQHIPQLRDLGTGIEGPHKALHESAARIAAARGRGDQDAAEAIFQDSSLPALGQVQDILRGMRKLVQERSDAKTKDLADTGSQVRSSVVLFTGISVVIGLLLGTLAALSISRPLKRGVRFALAIAEGDLDQDLDARRKDEVGRFCAALAAVRDAVKSVLAEYDAIVRGVEIGDFLRRSEPGRFKGGFAELIAGGNRIADIFVEHLDSIPSPVLTIDRNFTVLYMNKAGQKVAGHVAAGRKCHDLFRTSDCKTDQCACGRAMRETRVASSETDAHPQGLDLDISYTGSPIRDRSGAVVGALEIVTDQTQVMAARRKMQRCADDAMGISHQVSAAAEQLSAQAAQSSRGAKMEAQRLSETATAMEEMNATVLEVAKSASHSAESSDKARQKAQEGAAIVSDMVVAINDVQRRTAELKNNMSALGKRAESIGQVMNVINDIADQTNLLALNAAIEAARAGDAGRGFAVVADEVRKLAEKTMAATKEVGDAITGIQHETRANIDTVEASAKIIETATNLAHKSGQSLGEIVKLVEVASDQVRSIATASEEQSAASEEINRAVEEVSRIAAETSSAMQQSAQAVTDLSSQAQRLNSLIDELREAGAK